MSRLIRLSVLGTALTSLACAGFFAAQGQVRAKLTGEVDLLILGGEVYDGSLELPKIQDIGIVRDKIVFVGDASGSGILAKKTLDAKGLMVMPGLIDAHTHAEAELTSSDSAKRLVVRQITQGVTTSVIGVDGDGTPDVKANLDKMEALGIGQNVATYVGFGAIRERVLGKDSRAPSPVELERMKSLAATGMCEGAVGLSAGLYYAPQSFASTEEVIAVAKEAGKRGGLYDTHQRDEGDTSIGVLHSLTEAIRIGAQSGAPLHVGHIKVAASPHHMSELVTLIEAARAAGQNVTADQYPWTAGNTGLDDIVMPRWAQAGGRPAMLKRFANAAQVAKIHADTILTPAIAEAIVITDAPHQPEIIGKRLSELAAQWHIAPIDAAIRILGKDAAGIVLFVMNEQDIVSAMPQPWVMSSSDGEEAQHPRGHATFPRLWENYVVAQKVLTPVQFVHRSTGLPADTFGLNGRGYLKVGYFADVTVIDPKAYHARATYVAPTLLSTGVIDVIVNGGIELEGGKLTGAAFGRPLRKTPRSGMCG